MPEPVRLAILVHLTELLSRTVGPPNMQFDLTGRVSRGRRYIGTETALPFVTLVESPQQLRSVPEVPRAGYDGHLSLDTWTFFVQGFVKNAGGEHPLDDAYRLGAAVQYQFVRVCGVDVRNDRPVHPKDYMFGRKITKLRLGPPATHQGESPTDAATFYFPVTVELAYDVGDPFGTTS